MAPPGKDEAFKFVVEPSDNIFNELGNNTYDFLDLISELIDNSLAARVEGELLKVNITVALSADRTSTAITISDTASGIPRSLLGQAISPAARKGKGLNEHGLGLKQAVASLGTLQSLITKTIEDSNAVLIKGFHFGEITPELVQVDWPHGTEIRVINLRRIVPMDVARYTRAVMDQLGARYRRFLRPDDPRMKLLISLLDRDSDDKVIFQNEVAQVKPVYFHPKTRLNEPSIYKAKFKGRGWEAELTFGYAPEGKEYDELGLKSPGRSHPYHVSLKNQGLDIIRNDRVISFHQLSEIDLVDARHNSFNLIRGEVDLVRGFSTAITKNMVLEDQHFTECRDLIKEHLIEGKFLTRKTYPGDIPEGCLRDRLAKWLKENTVAPKNRVTIEYGVQALDGNIDIFADGEAWELKRQEAYGLDVYQLFAYMDVADITRGHLVAPSFRPSAHATVAHIKEKHKKEIVLDPLSNYPINDPMDDEEREKYL